LRPGFRTRARPSFRAARAALGFRAAHAGRLTPHGDDVGEL